MVNVIPPKTPDPLPMYGKPVPFADSPERPVQFSLKQLLLVMLAISFACALLFQWGLGGLFLCLVVGCIAAMCYGAYWGNTWFWLGLAGFLLAGYVLMVSAVSTPRWARGRSECQLQLKQIGMALHNYHDEHGCFPPAYVADATGTPMHSWRVLLLPYIEQQALYDRYNFNEPWDGPNNSKLAAEIPSIYCCPRDIQPRGTTDASYLAIVGTGTAWHGETPVSLGQIVDGTSNTLLVVESHGTDINWMEPRDLHALQMATGINPLKGQGICSLHSTPDSGPGQWGAQALVADGSVHMLENNTPPKTIDAMLTIAGGETVTWP